MSIEPLTGDPKRQGIPTIAGFNYQAWQSIDEWLTINDPESVIYLEGAEDYDIITAGLATTVQIKRKSQSISLNTKEACNALENFWKLSKDNPERQLQYHYVTTSKVASEQEVNFRELKGIEAWTEAKTDINLAAQIQKHLINKLDKSSSLKKFLKISSPLEFQSQIVGKFKWLTEQPDIDILIESVNDRIVLALNEKGLPLGLVDEVRNKLWAYYSEIVILPKVRQRYLNLPRLLRQFDSVQSVIIPREDLSRLLAQSRPEVARFNALTEAIPEIVSPLLERTCLVERVKNLIINKKVVVLAGTVFKGKSTLASLVAHEIQKNAWWIDLKSTRDHELYSFFSTLSEVVEAETTPNLIVIDDLDISFGKLHKYQKKFSLLLRRVKTLNIGLVFTSKGSSEHEYFAEHFPMVEVIEVPAFSEQEIIELCRQHSCPEGDLVYWSTAIFATTTGHPRLVSIKIEECIKNSWRQQVISDFMTASGGSMTAQQLARRLLLDTTDSVTAEFIYLLTVSIIPLKRSIAVRLGESVNGISNSGDVLDLSVGTWLEVNSQNEVSVTVLLRGLINTSWSEEKIRKAHLDLYDSIKNEYELTTMEAGALLFHAYMGRDEVRLIEVVRMLQGSSLRKQLYKKILWICYVALDNSNSLTRDPLINTMFRFLQFDVASESGSDVVGKIIQRWEKDLSLIEDQTQANVAKSSMSIITSTSSNKYVSLTIRLSSILSVYHIDKTESPVVQDMIDAALASSELDLPDGHTLYQLIMLHACHSVDSKDSLSELIEWLEVDANQEIRKQFDNLIKWPVVQSLGAFVHSAWISDLSVPSGWVEWIPVLDSVINYATQFNSSNLGIEASKAKAIILVEYLDKQNEAISVLDNAEDKFGNSEVLIEQRANTYFQIKNDDAALAFWRDLKQSTDSEVYVSPFSYQRLGISAARLEKWSLAREIFEQGAKSSQPVDCTLARYGLLVDAALSSSLEEKYCTAMGFLVEAVELTPAEASVDGDKYWEGVQRAASTVSQYVENKFWGNNDIPLPFPPGYASSPDAHFFTGESGQDLRTAVTQSVILERALCINPDRPVQLLALNDLVGSDVTLVNWSAAKANLSYRVFNGEPHSFFDAFVKFQVTTEIVSAETGQKINSDWFGLFFSFCICTKQNIADSTSVLHEKVLDAYGAKYSLTEKLDELVKSSSYKSQTQVLSIMCDSQKSSWLRCGAALVACRMDFPARETYLIQSFLISICMSDESYAFQRIFNRSLAINFANQWLLNADRIFYRNVDKALVSSLRKQVEKTLKSDGKLKQLMLVAAKVVGEVPDVSIKKLF